ncbi:MAG: PKD domain-containing protein [Saprospiraceae bacterium]|nr:PKD domain-containing protein [Saprospiraceae bacterium]
MFRQIIILYFLISGFSIFIQTDVKTQFAIRHEAEDPTRPDWINEMYKKNADPGKVISLYEEYYKTNEFVKNEHTQYYKRWIRSILRENNRTKDEDRDYAQKSTKQNSTRTNDDWSCIGPIDWDHSAAARSYAPGSAHVYTVEQSISNPDILYAGTATAGLWKTINHGVTWTPLTNGLLQSTVYAIEIDHSNANIIYASLQNSIYKSVNGGNNFSPTGNSGFQALDLDVRDIRMLPGNSAILFVCTDQGLFRTTNSGTGWTNVQSGDFEEVEIHPTNTNIIYAVRKSGTATQFFKSVNGGSTFSQTGTGWPVPTIDDHQERTELAVSPDNPDYVYAHCSGSANRGSGLYGVYVSNNQGANWTFKCCGPQPAGIPSLSNPNLMGWSDDGTDDGGQYYYDMGFAVSPTNSDTVLLAGVNLWVSGNGGTTFSCPSKWSHSYKPNYVHADIHDVHYYAHTREIWIACDGGIFFSEDNGVNFLRRNVGIQGTDFWGYGQGWWYGDVMLGGAYHNGTLLREESVYINNWLCTDGGDGTMGFVNPGFDRQAYSQYDIKQLRGNRTLSPITRTFQHKPNNTYITGASSDLLFDPRYYTHWISGSGTRFMKTKDNGYTFETLSDLGANVGSTAQCWSNPNVIYACTFPDWWGLKSVYRSDNGGYSWTNITPTSATVNGNTWIPYDIEVDHNDPMKVWLVRTSMYDSNINGYSVFYSSNGGQTWQNISGTGLNGHSPTSLYLQKGSAHGLYVGTHKAVFYRDDTMNDWVLFNNGLPAQTHSTRLEGYYRKQKIRNATNRSVWESEFNNPSIPVAFPSSDKDMVNCIKDTVYFVDHSVVSDQNVNWSWSFPGGTPSSSNLRNPKVLYTQNGTYDVTLTVSDVYGSNTKTINNMITVNNQCGVDTIPGKALKAAGTNQHGQVANANLGTTNTITVTAWVKPNGIQPDYSGIFMSDGPDAAGMNFKNGNNSLAYHWPGGSWSWNSGLIVTPNVWNFVAMTVTPTGITLYCNESQATHTINLTATDISGFRIGSYRGWSDRNMNGWIDEVAVYNRALSQAEIRELRHLVKNPQADNSLVAYYQFNANGQNDYDKVGSKHISLLNSALKEPSGIPVGKGLSKRLSVTSGGIKDFNPADMVMYFPSSGTYPNGELVVSKINQVPNAPPPGITIANNYWVINNYGSNQNFSLLDSFHFKNATNIAGGCQASFFGYHRREQHDEGNTWGNVRDNGDRYDPPLPGKVVFSTNNSFRTGGQYVLVRNNTNGNPNINDVCNGIDDNCNGLVDENYTLLVNNGNDSGSNTLRAVLQCAAPGETIQIAAGIDTIFLTKAIEINKNINIDFLGTGHVVIKGNLNAPGFSTTNYMIRVQANKNVDFSKLYFYQQNNSLTKPLLENLGDILFENCILGGNPAAVLRNSPAATCSFEGTVWIK